MADAGLAALARVYYYHVREEMLCSSLVRTMTGRMSTRQSNADNDLVTNDDELKEIPSGYDPSARNRGSSAPFLNDLWRDMIASCCI